MVKNIIFDLGGVILDLDIPGCAQAFAQLGGDFSLLFSFEHQLEALNDFETGKLSVPDFRNTVREVLHIKASDAAIDTAFNAMLKGIPVSRIDFLHALRSNYRIYIYSNTNPIHILAINNYIKSEYDCDSLNAFFDHIYYSSEMGYRKPDPKGFQVILSEQNLHPGETLFIDDNYQNVSAALSLGMQAWHKTEGTEFAELITRIQQNQF